MRRCRARSRRPWRRRCGLAGSAVLRATFWPTTALLLLLVAGLLAICLVLLRNEVVSSTSTMAAAGWCGPVVATSESSAATAAAATAAAFGRDSCLHSVNAGSSSASMAMPSCVALPWRGGQVFNEAR